jgi:hypothetical protein
MNPSLKQFLLLVLFFFTSVMKYYAIMSIAIFAWYGLDLLLGLKYTALIFLLIAPPVAFVASLVLAIKSKVPVDKDGNIKLF